MSFFFSYMCSCYCCMTIIGSNFQTAYTVTPLPRSQPAYEILMLCIVSITDCKFLICKQTPWLGLYGMCWHVNMCILLYKQVSSYIIVSLHIHKNRVQEQSLSWIIIMVFKTQVSASLWNQALVLVCLNGAELSFSSEAYIGSTEETGENQWKADREYN